MLDNIQKPNTRLIIILAVILVGLFIFSFYPSSKGDKKVKGIVVSEGLRTYVEEHYDINYCKVLRKAVKGDTEAMRKLSLLEINDSPAYDHGCVLVELIDKVGEDRFLLALGGLTWEQEKRITSYLLAGLEYGNGQHQNQEIEEAFPKIIGAFSNNIKK